jgi:hypothetical protein
VIAVLVVVNGDHLGARLLEDPGAVALTRAGLDDTLARTAGGEPRIHDLVAGEPVLLAGDPGYGPFAGQRQ